MSELSHVGTVGAEIDRVVRRTILTVPPHALDGLHAANVALHKEKRTKFNLGPFRRKTVEEKKE